MSEKKKGKNLTFVVFLTQQNRAASDEKNFSSLTNCAINLRLRTHVGEVENGENCVSP